MPTAKVRWKESEVTRVFRAAEKAGKQVRVEIRPDGTLVATPLPKELPADSSTADAELERWRMNRDAA
jgi:hypothetical protein